MNNTHGLHLVVQFLLGQRIRRTPHRPVSLDTAIPTAQAMEHVVARHASDHQSETYRSYLNGQLPLSCECSDPSLWTILTWLVLSLVLLNPFSSTGYRPCAVAD